MASVRVALNLSSPSVMSTALTIGVSMSVLADSGSVQRVKILGTSAASNPITLYKASDKLDNAYLYVKNMASEKERYIYVFADTTTDDPVILKIGGGEFAFLPVKNDQTLKAYGTLVDQIVEFAVFGYDDSSNTLS